MEEKKMNEKISGVTTEEEALIRAKVYAKRTGDTELYSNVSKRLSELSGKKKRGLASRVRDYFSTMRHPAYKKADHAIKSSKDLYKAMDAADILGEREFLRRYTSKIKSQDYSDRLFANNLLRRVAEFSLIGAVDLSREITHLVDKSTYEALEEEARVSGLGKRLKDFLKMTENRYDESKKKMKRMSRSDADFYGIPDTRRTMYMFLNSFGNCGSGKYEIDPQKMALLTEPKDPKERIESSKKIFEWDRGSAEQGVVGMRYLNYLIAYNGFDFMITNVPRSHCGVKTEISMKDDMVKITYYHLLGSDERVSDSKVDKSGKIWGGCVGDYGKMKRLAKEVSFGLNKDIAPIDYPELSWLLARDESDKDLPELEQRLREYHSVGQKRIEENLEIKIRDRNYQWGLIRVAQNYHNNLLTSRWQKDHLPGYT